MSLSAGLVSEQYLSGRVVEWLGKSPTMCRSDSTMQLMSGCWQSSLCRMWSGLLWETSVMPQRNDGEAAVDLDGAQEKFLAHGPGPRASVEASLGVYYANLRATTAGKCKAQS